MILMNKGHQFWHYTVPWRSTILVMHIKKLPISYPIKKGKINKIHTFFGI